MLLTRVLSAVVLAPLVVWLVYTGGWAFRGLIWGAAAVAAWELGNIALPASSGRFRALMMALAALACALVTGPAGGGAWPMPFDAADALAAAALVLFSARVVRPGAALPDAVRDASVGLAAVVYAGVLPAYLVRLRDLDPGVAWVLFAFAGTWLNDTAAYFAGRAFGRRKLHVRVSPGKSWEGAVGGFVGTLAALFALRAWLVPELSPTLTVVMALGAAVLGPLGDLSESLMKRASGVKDSGRIIPGHGGLLDRIDALLFVAPWIYWCARWGLSS